MNQVSIIERFIRFILLGIVAIFFEYIVFFALLFGLGIDYRIATILSFVVGASVGFVLNRRYTFFITSIDRKYQQYIRYIVVNFFSMLIDFFVVYIVTNGSHVIEALTVEQRASLGKLIAISITMFFNFTAHRFYTFR